MSSHNPDNASRKIAALYVLLSVCKRCWIASQYPEEVVCDFVSYASVLDGVQGRT